MGGYLRLKTHQKKAMLKREIRFICLFICLFIYSCVNIEKKTELKTSTYVDNNFKLYSNEYKTIADSVAMYVNSALNEYLHIYNQEWQIDSLICLNSTRDKLVTTINNSTGACSIGVSDEIT